jgi:hypothetical protein
MLGGTFEPAARGESTINTVDRHAYGANLGWIDARANGQDGLLVGEFTCSGHVYAANVGWISLGDGAPANGMNYRNDSGTDFGVNRDASGQLTGLAWGANIGWVIFTNRTALGTTFEAPKVDLITGRFSGYAFAPNAGWIALSNLFAHVKTDVVVPGADSDGDGLPDAWELSQVGNLHLMTADSNADEDLASDLHEYRADTDPLTPGDELRVIDFSVTADTARTTISWSSRPTRLYRIEQSPVVGETAPWTDAGLGWFAPDPGGTTTRVLVASPGGGRYLRIRAASPLAP